MRQEHNTAVPERIIMGLLLGGIAYGCGIVLYPFSGALAWAGIFTFTSWPIYTIMRRYLGAIAAALAMMVISAIIVIFPLALVASDESTIHAIDAVLSSSSARIHLPPLPHWVVGIPGVGPQISAVWTKWSHDLITISSMARPYIGYIMHSALWLTMQLAGGLLQIVMALFIAFFFWINGDALGRSLTSLVRRVTGPYADRLLTVTGGTVRGTMYGVLGTAIIQGILTGIGFAISGVPAPILCGVLAALLAVLPVGAPLVWIPAAIWLAMSHHVGKGIFLAAYGTLIISGVEHLIRPMFISRGTQLPYLLTLLGLLGGVVAFGGLGIFLGPVLLGVGYSLVSEFIHNRLTFPPDDELTP